MKCTYFHRKCWKRITQNDRSPAMDLWELLLPRDLRPVVHEDNQAMIQVVRTGKNPTMRHLGRVHRVAIAWLHEQIPQQHIDLKYEVSERQAADIYTKAFTVSAEWDKATKLINVLDPQRFGSGEANYKPDKCLMGSKH